mgnify:FL=1|tara:strand:+ start:1582 stop:2193 length:612 start_codon:yes stop_codon:yes gene_type:complete
MTDRKKKLRIIQISLLILGIIIIFFTYGEKNKFSNEKDKLFKFTEKNVEKNSKDISEEDLNTFYNIEYSGLDLSGNRYILKSEKAISNNKNSEIINMTGVKAFFYFKDDTILTVSSDHAIYNNKTLDMLFNKNIIAIYENSKLTADKADYSNTLGLLTISDKVKVIDYRGSLDADKLTFDLNNQTLNVASYNNDSINADIKLK